MTESLTPSNSFSRLSVTLMRTASRARNSYARLPVTADSFWRSFESRSYMKTDCDFESVVPYASKTNTRLCFMRARMWRRLIRIAVGRMRMLGRRDESILRRSRGRRPYWYQVSAIFNPLQNCIVP